MLTIHQLHKDIVNNIIWYKVQLIFRVMAEELLHKHFSFGQK